MATKDTNAGLLSKMVRFVRNPTKDWSELDVVEPVAEAEPESGYSKLALKELIQRKRQNDFVRKREFDQLRKMRRNEPLITAELVERPSFFQSSSISTLDDRAQTIKKIDEIEAQMSRQWWKGKREGDTTNEANFPDPANRLRRREDTSPSSLPETQSPGIFSTTQNHEPIPSAYSVEGTADGDADGNADGTVDYATTLLGASSMLDQLATADAGKPIPAGQPALALQEDLQYEDAPLSEFSPSKLAPVKLGDTLDNPDLEEAAIRFANGDDAGAEATLITALRADDVKVESADSWATALFDLYRSTGQQDSFDSVAIDYAQRFGRSAPAWFSTPDLLGLSSRPIPIELAPTPKDNPTSWTCPAHLLPANVQAMEDRLRSASGVWQLNWAALGNMTVEAAQALAGLFARWSKQPVKLRFEGVGVLEEFLRTSTPAGDSQVDPVWWHLRMDVMRLLGMQDEFELAALDFCVTYEVSPPAWESVVCEVSQAGANAPPSPAATKAQFADSLLTQAGDWGPSISSPVGLGSKADEVELKGEVLGDAVEALDALQAGFKGSPRLVISCSRLIRVDFSAAGSILNWVAARDQDGCQIQFHDVPMLVAAFFHVIGISEHAQVILRTN